MTTNCNPDEIAKLKARIDALDNAIATGARSVTLGGQTIIYNTTESLRTAANHFRRQLAAAEAACLPTKVSRQSYAVFKDRGY